MSSDDPKPSADRVAHRLADLARIGRLVAAIVAHLGRMNFQDDVCLAPEPRHIVDDLPADLGVHRVGVLSCVAGVALDQFGPKKVVPLGAATVAIGAILFSTADPTLGSIGRFMQGAGGVFALIGAVYLVSTYMPASRAATLIGATQMFGMAGGSAGQFVVGPLIGSGLAWNSFWLAMGIIGIPIAALLLLLIPARKPDTAGSVTEKPGLKAAMRGFGAVFSNPQSYLCGLIAGLMFIPTTIFDMVWGVRFLQEAHGAPYEVAVLRSAAVPFGWIIGCPLLGWLSDRIGQRKPVIIGAAALLLATLTFGLYGPAGSCHLTRWRWSPGLRRARR